MAESTERLPLTVAVPTYRREAVLLQTLDFLLALQPAAAELLVVDQTEAHEPATAARLQALDAGGAIRWLRLARPSITQAMNHALLQATQPRVLFVDDDVRPEPQLLAAHWAAHQALPLALVAGRVVQPWEEAADAAGQELSGLAARGEREVREFIGCNFSVPREAAVAAGGFDENFVRVAYRYEAEFAHRFMARGGRIVFAPRACLHHLKDGGGGTRAYGDHLTTWRPDHAVGAYYCGLRTGAPGEFLRRPLRAAATRYHLRRPWRIPATLVAEARGMAWALGLFLRGPRLLGRAEGAAR
ncbi:glycosyltransferase family A protein [Ramlibacter sp.]|uniref:glycosyltransferase family 2 protein n=1 Tax=Ramlibacter sp. TaxID=1917967 RepID=UPI0017CDF809|nr:glycosyltransferase family A protein [Ramlibacter sp.]MBA2673574.1 glycosyltransferase family 2 protein [Ramlibacter sp.]